jgi:flagellar hook-basal body complex protein FliE
MSEIRIGGVGGLAPTVEPRKIGGSGGPGFGDALRQALGRVSDLQQGADRAAQAFSLGETRDVAGTLIAVEKASLGFQLTLQIRNKLLEAYQEIIRMPM